MTCVENMEPLNKVVAAAVGDSYEDWGKTRQMFSHWAARGLKKLTRESLPAAYRNKILLPVNPNTRTATLPLDFDEDAGEPFVGILDSRGYKVPLRQNGDIVDWTNVSIKDPQNKCDKCSQDKNICNDLVVTEEINLIVIGDTTYNETVVKKLYPNGDYFLETTTPYWDVVTEAVVYPSVPKREFIANLDLLPCGCLASSAANLTTLQSCAPEIYCSYYAPCDYNCNKSYGGYKIFPESGLIQFDANYRFDKVYLEYNGFLRKIKGQYMVPAVAFETLVEYTKFKSVDGKRNVSNADKSWRLQRYKDERANMEIILGRVSLSFIMKEIHSLPNFDIDYGEDWYSCFGANPNMLAGVTLVQQPCYTGSGSGSGGSGGSGGGGGGGSSTIINNTYITVSSNAAHILAVKVDGNPGSPVAGSSTYQNNVLIGATDVVYSILAKQILTTGDNDFTFNSTTGTIDISPNQFVDQDTLILHYNKTT